MHSRLSTSDAKKRNLNQEQRQVSEVKKQGRNTSVQSFFSRRHKRAFGRLGET